MRVNQRKDDLTEVAPMSRLQASLARQDLDMAALLPGAMIKLI